MIGIHVTASRNTEKTPGFGGRFIYVSGTEYQALISSGLGLSEKSKKEEQRQTGLSTAS